MRRGVKALLQLAFTLGPDATLNTEIRKNSVRKIQVTLIPLNVSYVSCRRIRETNIMHIYN